MKLATPREEQVFKRAVKFTVVRGVLSNRVRHDCATLEEAEALARSYGDCRTMIYAIDDMGGAAHIKNA